MKGVSAKLAWSTRGGRGELHLRHELLRAKTWSPQYEQIQSPGRMPWPIAQPPPPLPITVAPPPQPPICCAGCAWCTCCGEIGPTPRGAGVPHLRQAAFLANCRSPHAGQFQSPGRLSICCGACCVDCTVCACCAGGMVPHLRQHGLLAKTRSLQFGHIQSPGRGCPPHPVPNPCCADGGPAYIAPWLAVIGAAICGSGRGVAQRRHEAFLANCTSPQAGQSQSPARCCAPAPTSPPPQPPATRDCCVIAISSGGLVAPQRRQLVFFAKTRSPQLGQCQSPGRC